ncbi:TRAP transporter permease [Anaerobaca lacustris]|uniref:TRAP transporter permease n=1 Tax=Anaerobaca lacustris TaxID=3044600 RepID=A0AAW6TWP7_9BACT|nr:TRAP transporter permease [Sedimentisphaerales bacterium M17dextr]
MAIDRKARLERVLRTEEGGFLRCGGRIGRTVVSAIAVAWALFQLALPRFVLLDSITIRAIHLAFALVLVFLTIPFRKGTATSVGSSSRICAIACVLAALAALSSLYIVLDWRGISLRPGIPIWRDAVVAVALIVFVLEAARRVLGPALSVIALFFTLYAFSGPYLPLIFAFKGVSLTKYISQIALSTNGIYGIPLDVSANTIFLYVLLGALLAKLGAGQFFNDLAISLLGRFKGGAAKAAIVSSGLTGLVSGSSIANVVTTGTFTIPLMKKVGYPAKIAAATEVAASTNGQLMPPIMGAAAFIIAEYLGKPYIDVIKAAAIPAFVSYLALFYIVHLEASKLGMKGLPKEDIPRLSTVLAGGFYYLIPLVVLIAELVVLRHSPKLAAFNAILSIVALAFVVEVGRAVRTGSSVAVAAGRCGRTIVQGLIAGSRNMLTVALATAAAGIIVGIVAMGIGSMVAEIVEVLSAGNIFLLLLITAVASLVLGMGLPTTATYIVMASITVPVIIQGRSLAGETILIPAIAAHLFCFYFGILADDTPPVGLAAYTAAAIARSDPIATGIQGFLYDLRTAVIPFMFVFNAELLLYGVTSVPQAVLVFVMATLAAFAFGNATQGWFLVKNRWYELPLFLGASLILFYPALLTRLFHLDYGLRYGMYAVGLALYGLVYLMQRPRLRRIRDVDFAGPAR